MVKLKGKNQIGRFRQVAKRLVTRISKYEGVCGIVLLGGLARGFADRFSDLDLAVFLSESNEPLRRQIHEVALDEQKRSSIDTDILIYSLGDLEKQHWGETEKWMFSEAKIAFDPQGETKKGLHKEAEGSQRFLVETYRHLCGVYQMVFLSCRGR